jgi:hypothetical protein
MRRVVAIVVFAVLTSALVSVVASRQFAEAGPGAAPVREQNLDANGFIRVHEQGTATVHDAANPIREPFQKRFAFSFQGQIAVEDQFIVPAGKELVVTSMSAQASLPTGERILWVRLCGELEVGGLVCSYIGAPFQGQNGTSDEFVGTAPLLLYAAPGTIVDMKIARNGGGDEPAAADIAIAGYFVPAS